MKIINWQKTVTVIIYEPKQNDKVEYNPQITEGMRVVGKYGDNHDIHMVILAEIELNTFSAIVDYFEPATSEPPNDLFVGDVLQIRREDFSCIFLTR